MTFDPAPSDLPPGVQSPKAAILASLRQAFTPGEVQVTCSAAYPKPPADPDAFRAQVKERLVADSVVRSQVSNARVDATALLRKLDRSPPEMLKTFGDAIESWAKICFEESLYPWGRSSRVILARVGLLAVTGPAAWGFCCAVQPKWTNEFVLRRDIDDIDLGPRTDVESLGRELLDMCREKVVVPGAALMIAHQISALTGLRCFQIGSRSGGSEVQEIPSSTLAADLADGSMQHLWLKGVNAPD